jgi:hypothetical protein
LEPFGLLKISPQRGAPVAGALSLMEKSARFPGRDRPDAFRAK